jgi:hypothetical protein
MPEQQVAGPGEHAHTLEARGLAYVARAAVCRMQPQHIGLGAQAQVIADSSVYRGLRTLPAVTSAAQGASPIGCGVSLSRLMRAASLGLTAANGMAIRAKLSAPRLASSSCAHVWRGIAIGVRRR